VGAWLKYLVFISAFGPLAYYALAIFSTWTYRRSLKKLPPFDASYTPPVSLLKPVHGLDWGAYENFASMCNLDYPEYEIVFAVGHADDPIIPTIEKLRRDFPKTAIRLIIGVEQLGASRKTNKLCRLAKEAKYELLVMNDSDVRVEKDYLRDVTAGFRDPEVGVVTGFFRGITDGSFAAEVDAVGIPTEGVPNAILAKLLGTLDYAFGWTMAITKKRLAEIGGFEALVNHHSDDFMLGNEIARKGYRVEIMRKPVGMVFPRQTLREFFKHELRWMIQVKNIRLTGYLGLFFTFGLAWTLLVAAMGRSWEIAIAYAALYVVLRLCLAWEAGVRLVGDPTVRRKPWLVLVRDAVTLCLYIASFFSNTMNWRGLRYRVHGALLIPLPADAHSTGKTQRNRSHPTR
jgi:ceramide glucosyltransferase